MLLQIKIHTYIIAMYISEMCQERTNLIYIYIWYFCFVLFFVSYRLCSDRALIHPVIILF